MVDENDDKGSKSMKLLFVLGTRPEAVKLAPLIRQFRAHNEEFDLAVCVTAQHRKMLDQVLYFFDITPDYDLNLMNPNQSLFDITSEGLRELGKVLDAYEPHMIFVQGDTTTAFLGVLAGFYKKIKNSHIEAGLRSSNKYSPYPEEMNRVLIGHLLDYHFAPTQRAKQNLLNEGIRDNIWVVGNTVIDALFLGLDIIKSQGDDKYHEFFDFLDFSKKIILVTGHRRESFGKPFENICNALKEISLSFKDVEIVYSVHLNPNVKEPVNRMLNHLNRVHLL